MRYGMYYDYSECEMRVLMPLMASSCRGPWECYSELVSRRLVAAFGRTRLLVSENHGFSIWIDNDL